MFHDDENHKGDAKRCASLTVKILRTLTSWPKVIGNCQSSSAPSPDIIEERNQRGPDQQLVHMAVQVLRLFNLRQLVRPPAHGHGATGLTEIIRNFSSPNNLAQYHQMANVIPPQKRLRLWWVFGESFLSFKNKISPQEIVAIVQDSFWSSRLVGSRFFPTRVFCSSGRTQWLGRSPPAFSTPTTCFQVKILF